MISGRGLGHTGGTLDKLEAIPGFDIFPDDNRFRDIIKDVGVAIIGQAINGLAWGFLEPLQMILIQERADIKYLGRITGFVRFGLMSAGVLPLLAAPFLAEALGVQTVLFGASTIIALVGTLFFVTQGRRQGH